MGRTKQNESQGGNGRHKQHQRKLLPSGPEARRSQKLLITKTQAVKTTSQTKHKGHRAKKANAEQRTNRTVEQFWLPQYKTLDNSDDHQREIERIRQDHVTPI